VMRIRTAAAVWTADITNTSALLSVLKPSTRSSQGLGDCAVGRACKCQWLDLDGTGGRLHHVHFGQHGSVFFCAATLTASTTA
jgi:hypothetical protein